MNHSDNRNATNFIQPNPQPLPAREGEPGDQHGTKLSGLVAVVIGLALAPGAAAAATLHFRVDATRSAVTVSVAEPMASIRGDADGVFSIIAGDIYVDPANPTATGKVTLVIDATSYKSGSPERDRSVTQSSLDVDQYPTIGFESTDVSNVAETSPTDGSATIDGALTLHGQTHPVSVPVHLQLTSDGRAMAEGKTTIRYEEWGATVPEIFFLRAGNQATVSFHILANRSAS
jgi:polyisoprenoid-binding protein YceI